MNELEMKLKDLIKERYGALSKFAESIDMPWTTLDSILKRGIVNSNIANVLKITDALGLSADELANGRIVNKNASVKVANSQIDTLAAHFEGEQFTDEEMDEIMNFVEFVKNKRL